MEPERVEKRRGSMDEAGVVTRWDRSRWISVFSSHNPTIREVTECLGLGLSASSSTTNRGIPKFDNPEYRKISSEVTKLSKELPKEREALLDFAADPRSLDEKLEELLSVYGPAIWGKDTDRTCLLKADPTKKTYFKDLYFEDREDKEILKIHLHRWIIIKACYYIRNMKLKRSSIEHDTIADIDMEGSISPKPQLLSPDRTPQSASPPVSSPKVKTETPANERKRKGSAHVSVSDGEENPRPAVKRPYHSATVPIQRKSPRKSLKSLAMANTSNENFPPVPSHQSNQFYAPGADVTGPEPNRPLLSPLSSNDLNGAARPANASPGGFTAVNVAPSSHSPLNGANYSSPYGPPGSQLMVSTPYVPTINTAPVMSNGFHAINSPIVSNGTPSARNSPVVQHVLQNVSYANIAPQPAPTTHTPPTAHASSTPHPPSAPHVVVAPSSPHMTLPIHGLPMSSAHPAQSAPPAPPAQKILKSQPNETPISSSDTELLQCELLGSLMQYLFPKSDAKPNEAGLLRNLEYLWNLKASFFQRQMGSLFDVQSRVLLAWIEERRKISQLRRSMENDPGVPAPEMVDRLLAMNDLRVLRLKWKSMNTQDGNQTLSPEDLLCRNFAAMTNTGGTEYLFKDGLDRLNDSMFEFLRSEDMKIMMTKR